jgi:hypothetical protein
MENTEESKLNSEKIWKLWKKSRLNSEMIWKKGKLNSEMIWKIWKISVVVIITPKETTSTSAATLLLLPLCMYIHCFSELRRIILELCFFLLETMQVGIKFTISFI